MADPDSDMAHGTCHVANQEPGVWDLRDSATMSVAMVSTIRVSYREGGGAGIPPPQNSEVELCSLLLIDLFWKERNSRRALLLLGTCTRIHVVPRVLNLPNSLVILHVLCFNHLASHNGIRLKLPIHLLQSCGSLGVRDVDRFIA